MEVVLRGRVGEIDFSTYKCSTVEADDLQGKEVTFSVTTPAGIKIRLELMNPRSTMGSFDSSHGGVDGTGCRAFIGEEFISYALFTEQGGNIHVIFHEDLD